MPANRSQQLHHLRAHNGNKKRILHNGTISKLRVFLYPNDGGLKAEAKMVLVDSNKTLLDTATEKLNLAWGARRVFDMRGEETDSNSSFNPSPALDSILNPGYNCSPYV